MVGASCLDSLAHIIVLSRILCVVVAETPRGG